MDVLGDQRHHPGWTLPRDLMHKLHSAFNNFLNFAFGLILDSLYARLMFICASFLPAIDSSNLLVAYSVALLRKVSFRISAAHVCGCCILCIAHASIDMDERSRVL